MLKLSFIETSFSQKKNITVCKLVCSFRQVTRNSKFYENFPPHVCKKFGLNLLTGKFVVIGKAIRHEDDTDNPIVAKHLAESRAKKKAYQKGKKILEIYIKDIERIYIDSYKSCKDNLKTLEEKEIQHTEKILDEVR